ncbi:MAG TPA: gliding-motility protein MglA [Archangium sp.]|nr:gliding-motility protein MglA [Archangium sp.]
MLGRLDFFDFAPPSLGKINGFTCRIHVFIVLKHVVEENTRRFNLQGVDGVIFVADSQRQRAEANLSSLEELESNLAAGGSDSAKVARAYSYNKRDLPDALPVAELEEKLNPQRKYPSFETIASQGVGVFDPLKAVVKTILRTAKGG